MIEHKRGEDDATTYHRRSTDDIILELLRLVQGVDKRLEEHIEKEMQEIKEALESVQEKYEKLITDSFPEGNPAKHKQSHLSLAKKLLALIKRD